MTKRILILGLNFSPELIGIGKFSGELAEALSQKGHSLRVVTTVPYYPAWQITQGYSSKWYRKEMLESIEVIRCPLWVPRRVTGLSRILHLLSFAISSFPAMLLSAKWRPDLILCVTPTLLSTPWAILFSRLMKIPAWCHVHDFELEASLKLGVFAKGTIGFRILLQLEGFLLREFDRVSTLSDRMLDVLHSKGVEPSKTMIMPNWVDTNLIYPLEEISPLRKRLKIPDGQCVILYSGNLGMKQGLESLLAAASKLSNHPSITFVICGDGAERANIVDRAEGMSNVMLIPLQPYAHLNDLLNLADIHVLPQRSGFADLVMPSKLSGMLASGKPVIATADSDTELGTIVGEVGLLVPAGEEQALVQAILSLSKDLRLRSRMGSKGRLYAERHFGKQVILADFESKVLNLLAR